MFAQGLAHKATQQHNKMHHMAQRVVREQCLAPALAHNISQQTKKLLFLQNSCHPSTQRLSHGRFTLWSCLCGLFSWCRPTSWLLEWSSHGTPGFLRPRSRCCFLCLLALGRFWFLIFFFIVLLLLIIIWSVSSPVTNFAAWDLEAVFFCLPGRFLTSHHPLCCTGLRGCCLTLLLKVFFLQFAHISTVLVIPNLNGNYMVGPAGLLIPITTIF